MESIATIVLFAKWATIHEDVWGLLCSFIHREYNYCLTILSTVNSIEYRAIRRVLEECFKNSLTNQNMFYFIIQQFPNVQSL